MIAALRTFFRSGPGRIVAVLGLMLFITMPALDAIACGDEFKDSAPAASHATHTATRDTAPDDTGAPDVDIHGVCAHGHCHHSGFGGAGTGGLGGAAFKLADLSRPIDMAQPPSSIPSGLERPPRA